MKKINPYISLIVCLLVPLSFGLYAQSGGIAGGVAGNIGGGGGGGGASVLAANTWTQNQTFSGGTTSGSYNFTAGSQLTEISNGVVRFQDSFASIAATLRLGGSTVSPTLTGGNRRLVLATAGSGDAAALAFSGALPGSCSGGDIVSITSSVPKVCTGFGDWSYLGPTDIPTSLVGGTGPSMIPAAMSGGTASFRFTVGTGGVATDISFSLGAAHTGWNCNASNITANAAHRADQRVVQTAGTTTSNTLQNQLVSTGAATAFAASDVIGVVCSAF